MALAAMAAIDANHTQPLMVSRRERDPFSMMKKKKRSSKHAPECLQNITNMPSGKSRY